MEAVIIKKLLLKSLMFVTLITIQHTVQAAKITIDTHQVQSSRLKAVIIKKITELKQIAPEGQTADYYVALMYCLYQGANEVAQTEATYGKNKRFIDLAGSFINYHTQMMALLEPYRNKKPKQLHEVDAKFGLMVKGAITNFNKIVYPPEIDQAFTKVMVEYYENMDQVIIAFTSFGKGANLKALSWKIIAEQNVLIDRLKDL
jgi:hypothetical protein